MATIESYKTNSGTTLYAVRYRKPGNKQTMKRGFTSKRRAEDWATKTEHDKMTGSYVAPRLGRITVGELAPTWLARKRTKADSYYKSLEISWRIHVQPRRRTTPVADIETLDVEDWLLQKTANGSSGTIVLRARDVMAGILNDAVRGKRLAVNPVKAVENLPSKTKKRHIYLTAEDVTRLADEAGQHRVLVLVPAWCGIRWGEAVGLRVRDVEFLRRRLSVHDNAVQLGSDFAVGLPKGKEPRSVPVPEFVLNELSVHVAGKAPSDLVFGKPDGSYLPRPKTYGGWFSGAVKRSGVQRVTPHDLRHTCASLAVSGGGNVLALQRMLGHKSAKLTLDTYADLFDDDLDAVADLLHARYSGVVAAVASR